MAGRVKGSPQRRMIVVPYQPWRDKILLAAGGGMLVLAVIVAYGFGYQRGGGSLNERSEQLEQLIAYRESAESDLENLRTQLALIERTRQVDQQATELAQATMAALRQRIGELERDVGLYRQVMNLPAEQATLQLLHWRVWATEVADRYRYELVIATAGYEGDAIDVRVEVRLHMAEQNDSDGVPLSEFDPGLGDKLHANFRFMHRFSGYLELPERVRPQQVEIAMEDVQRTFSREIHFADWKISGEE
jgi:alkanesulfonate monooxygenase SsuD/methylene tetrahydromethanopterin reductase-like flavin-dependent oxidoreductase (luciferase family)